MAKTCSRLETGAALKRLHTCPLPVWQQRLYLLGAITLNLTFALRGQAVASRQNTLQAESIVRLGANQKTISASFGGKTLQLLNASPVISLPPLPPRPDESTISWEVAVKNLGPAPVLIRSSRGFQINVSVGEEVHIRSTGLTYRVFR